MHLGHVAGAYLPADIFARYHRTKGNEVLMVSGSDRTARRSPSRPSRKGPAESPTSTTRSFWNPGRSWASPGPFTTTETPNKAVTQDIFLMLQKRATSTRTPSPSPTAPNASASCPTATSRAPARSAGHRARGDQCDACGKPLNPHELIRAALPHLRHHARVPETPSISFLKLSAFQEQLLDWVETAETTGGPTCCNFTLRYLEEG